MAETTGVTEMAGMAETAGIGDMAEVAHTAPAAHTHWPRRVLVRVRGISGAVARRVAAGGDRGMATAEYAIATIAAVGFAGLLIVVLRSGEVRGLLLGIIRGALST
ncbi:DUF4244 domain-containing protein [Cellulomonas cellasea]|uniref:DUF4244 domain-containing protein n=1 Tax=Cellulomonas cellasea TaxID=43670 RepID=UPI0025A3F97B|nr:DUF4244 domain-containing protein [Cellulomonas cellasea]MDM8085600.1 DUF4244 domain-containing protein [Cellulomonas cellasea]